MTASFIWRDSTAELLFGGKLYVSRDFGVELAVQSHVPEERIKALEESTD